VRGGDFKVWTLGGGNSFGGGTGTFVEGPNLAIHGGSSHPRGVIVKGVGDLHPDAWWVEP